MIALNVNGQSVSADAAPDTPLLWVLRDYLNLTGTKFGCGMALCGACTVHLDGQPTRSCVTPVSAVSGKKITTIEGLSTSEADRVSKAVQDAWNKLDVVQCGYCQSGQIMAATALLRVKKKPTDSDIDAAMTGNVCRCVTYVRIRVAIKQAARALA
jgi:isoquinoline 1-oxidoreductase alpha subunit